MKKKKRKERKEPGKSGKLERGVGENDRGRWFCILILVVLPLIYFFPYLFDPDRMIFGTDWIPTGGYARMVWQRSYFLDFITVPKWMPYLFSGFSVITAYGDTFFYPLNLLTMVFPTHLQRVILFALHPCIGGIGIFFFLQLLGCGLYPALFAGVVYEFSGSILTTTYAGHLGRMIAAALLPVSFYFLYRALKRRTLQAFLLFGGFLGLHLLGGHFQMTYLALVSMSLGTLYYLVIRVRGGWKERRNLVLYFSLAVFLASALTAVRYLPPYAGLGHGARGVERGYEYATSWSLPLMETFDLLIPHFSGSSIQGLDNYWGSNYFKLSNEYIGVLPLLLAVITIMTLWRRRKVQFFFSYTVLFLLFAYGGNTPFYRLPYYSIPLLSRLRAPAMLFFMASFGLIALAGIGIHAATSDDPEKRIGSRAFGVMAAVIFLLALLLMGFGDSFLGVIERAIGDTIEMSYGVGERARRLGLLEQSFPRIQLRLWIAFLISLALYAGIHLFEKERVTRRQLIFGFLLVTVIDQWSVDRHYLKSSPSHDRLYAVDDVVAFLQRDTGVFRVFPIQYNHARDGLLLLHGIESIGGYGANPPRRYQRFIGAGESVMFNPSNLYQDRGLLDILNVKYIIVPPLPADLSGLSPVEKNMAAALKSYLSGYTQVFSGSHSVYSNPNYLPRAYVAFDYQVTESEEEALQRVLSGDFDHHRSVILETDPGIPIGDNTVPVTSAEIVEHDSHRLVCSVDLPVPGILVVSENHHPDWKVAVDGEEKEVLHVNYVLKGVALTSGAHTVEFVYRSLPFRIGQISTIASFFVVAFLVLGWRKGKF